MEQQSERTMWRVQGVNLAGTFYLSTLSLYLEHVARPQDMYRSPETGDVIWLNLAGICFAVFLVVVPCVLGLLWLSAKWRGRLFW